MWFGKKQHSKDKFNTGINLECNIAEFKLLGIMFSVDLHRIPNLNFEPLLGKVKCIWYKYMEKKCHLTPREKITVLKNIYFCKLQSLVQKITYSK